MANNTKAKNVRRPGTGGGVGSANVGQAEEAQQPESRKPGAEQKAAVKAGDASRPGDAPVNRKPSLDYASAMAQRKAGKLTRAVLTDQGWVMPSAAGRIRLES